MAGPSAYLEVARTAGAVYVRVMGYGSFAVARPMREFAEACIREGQRQLVLDLSGARSIDSTFMGTVAALCSAVDPAGEGTGWIQVVNANAQCAKVMGDVGLEKLVRVRDEPVAVPDIPRTRLDPELGTPAERLHTAADAHRRLLPLDPENERRFRPVLQLLDKELAALAQRGQ